MADEPTLSELARRLDDRVGDIREDIRELGARLDTRVSMERYQLEQQARDDAYRLLLERVKGMEEAAKKRDDQRAADRRLVLTALVAPALLLLLQAYIAAKGAGG